MNRRLLKRVLLLIAPLIIGIAIIRIFTPSPSALTYESLGVSAAQALQGARDQAESYGLVGEPTREEGALMTYGSYLALTDSPFDNLFPMDHPVYVYQVFGEIPVYQYVSSNDRTDIAGMIFAFDGIAGTWFDHRLILDGLEYTAYDLSFIPEAASRGNVSQQHRSSTPLRYEDYGYTEQGVLQGARDQAESYGLVGEPTREEGALMTYGSYLTLTDSPDAWDLPDSHPIYVYQVFGNIPVFNYYGGGDAVAGMVFAVDMTTGMDLQVIAIPHGREHTAYDLSFIPEAASRGNVSPILPTLIQMP